MRFSILSLLGLVAFAAVGCAALAQTSFIWAAFVTSLAAVSLCIALVAAIMLRGRQQAFWIGFVAAGLLYHHLAVGTGYAPKLVSTELAIRQFAFYMEVEDVFLNQDYTYLDAFTWTAQSLMQLLLAYIGGCVALFCYSLRQKQNTQAAEQRTSQTPASGGGEW